MNKITLFCFSHMGGSASNYYQWKLLFPSEIEICPIELAGRGERNEESFYQNFEEMILDISQHIVEKQPERYALWGHSMGALIAYEITYHLMKQGMTSPIHIFFSGRNTPDIKDDMFSDYMDNNMFLQKINQIGGIPRAVWDYPELMDMIFPILRADYEIMSTYGFSLHEQNLMCDITIIAGDKDKTIKYEEMYKWKLITAKKCEMYYMPGGHFYIENNLNKVVELVKSILSKY